jgi:hypothetical protein
MTGIDPTANRPAVFRLHGADVQVEPGPTHWRARVMTGDGEPVSGWVEGRRAWQAVELAVERWRERG